MTYLPTTQHTKGSGDKEAITQPRLPILPLLSLLGHLDIRKEQSSLPYVEGVTGKTAEISDDEKH